MHAEYHQDDPFLLLCDLDRKSRDRSGGLPAFHSEEDGWTGVLFTLREKELLASMAEVSEIVPLEALTPIPSTSKWLLGVMNLRGNLLPVIDLEGFLYSENLHGNESRCRLLVIDDAGSPVGLLVRSVLGMKHYRNDDVAIDVPTLDEQIAQFVNSSYQRQKSHHAVFGMQQLLGDERFRLVTDK